MPSQWVQVTCPSCFQHFRLLAPPPGELPADLDYDCEICCRPMIVHVEISNGDIWAEARGINE